MSLGKALLNKAYRGKNESHNIKGILKLILNLYSCNSQATNMLDSLVWEINKAADGWGICLNSVACDQPRSSFLLVPMSWLLLVLQAP